MTMLAVWISAVRSFCWKGRKLSAKLPKAQAAGLMRSGNLQPLHSEFMSASWLGISTSGTMCECPQAKA